ncbi:receptor-like protein 19 [Salvia divinorum]|uniref:Receptor-like protein 19 n=1 Tax=Salvia divinorum TaxID=28513 RepID=A0ABD1GE32_SALDI
MAISPFLFFFFIIFVDGQCLDHQKNLLLDLKSELAFNSSLSSKLVTWNQTHDCCEWGGVECDGAGRVVSLLLGYESISDTIGESSTLFRLTHLSKLSLAGNGFIPSQIPKRIHRLTNLRHLDLSSSGPGSTKSEPKDDYSTPSEPKDEEIKWEYVFAASGYVVGLGSVAWTLLCCRSLRERYFEKIEEVVDKIFYERGRRRRHERRVRRREERRNGLRRHHQ